MSNATVAPKKNHVASTFTHIISLVVSHHRTAGLATMPMTTTMTTTNRLCSINLPLALLFMLVVIPATALVQVRWNVCGARLTNNGPTVTGAFTFDADLSGPPYSNIAIQSNGVTYSNVIAISPGNNGLLVAMAGSPPGAAEDLTNRQVIRLTFATGLQNQGGQVSILNNNIPAGVFSGTGTCGNASCVQFATGTALEFSNNPFVSTNPSCTNTPTAPPPTVPPPSPPSPTRPSPSPPSPTRPSPPTASPNGCPSPSADFIDIILWLICLVTSIFGSIFSS
jgi:hypothetical protein